jgi:hypothetical protein
LRFLGKNGLWKKRSSKVNGTLPGSSEAPAPPPGELTRRITRQLVTTRSR